ncbi:MAG: SsrA-binding protein SmpB [Alphaproteobacteria bacterium]
MPKKPTHHRTVAQNRKALHDYFIDERMEAGVMLAGTEVKALRAGNGNLADAYAQERGGEIFLFNAYIPEYAAGSYNNHETRRPRKLLLHKKQISKLLGAVKEKTVTLIPLAIFFNDRGIAKVELGLARGKKQYDKRDTDKKRDWERQRARLLRHSAD